MTILFHVPNNVGLGHLSRLLAVATAVRELDQHQPILFLTELPETRLIQEADFPHYLLPDPHDLVTYSCWQLLQQEANKFYLKTVRKLFETYRPSLLIHDTGLRADLFTLAAQHSTQQALIMRLRTDLIRYLGHNHKYLETLSLLCFAHETHEIPPLGDLLTIDKNRVIFAGPLLRRSIRDLDLPRIRRAYGIQSDMPTVVVTNGGGLNPTPGKGLDDGFIDQVLAALSRIQQPLRLIIFPGPLIKELPILPSHFNGHLIVRDFDPYLFDLMAAANLVISRGGYNTIHELQQIGVPAICVPAVRGVDDQIGRIEHAAAVSPNIHLVELDKEAIQEAVSQTLTEPPWSYHSSPQPDAIAANKLALAEKLLGLLEHT